MQEISSYREAFIAHMNSKVSVKEPENLYEPISYILNLGGKRLRPILVLMATEIFGEDYTKGLDAALAVEVFHNFSLVHDDIMDDAPLRRGKDTVHEKWDLNTGILSGDDGRPPYAGLVVGQLSEIGYDAEWRVVSAEDAGAPHKRERWWCLAHKVDDPEHDGRNGSQKAGSLGP